MSVTIREALLGQSYALSNVRVGTYNFVIKRLIITFFIVPTSNSKIYNYTYYNIFFFFK